MDTDKNILEEIVKLRIDLNNKIGDLTKVIENQTCEITSLKEIIQIQRTDIEAINERLTVQESRISELEKIIADKSNNMDSGNRMTEIDNLSSSVASLTTNIEALREDNNKLNDEVVSIREQCKEQNFNTTYPKQVTTNTTTHKSSFKNNNNKQHPNSNLDNELTLVLFGIEEPKQENPKERFGKLKDDVTRTLDQINVKPEETITNYRRIGRYDSIKKRPIILQINSIWSKNYILQRYSDSKKNNQLNFTLAPNVPITRQDANARAKAKQLNEEEKSKSSHEDREVNISYSAKPNGSILVYKKDGNEWSKSDELKTDSTSHNNNVD